MKDAEGVDERLARIGRVTGDIVAPPGLDRRILAAMAARTSPVGAWWDAVWSSSRSAVVASLCASVASVALAIHLDATLITTLASAAEGEADVAMAEP
jgi:hypothetical protein